MKNLVEMLRNNGLSEEQANKTIEVIYEWLEKTYPVLATLAKNTLLGTKNDMRGTMDDPDN